MKPTTSRTLKLLRSRGLVCWVAERWNQFAGVRQDAFSFGDVLAYDPIKGGVWLVQSTTGDNHAARKDKILSIGHALGWLRAGGRILLVSWRLAGARSERYLWTAREEEIVLADFKIEEPGPVEETFSEIGGSLDQ